MSASAACSHTCLVTHWREVSPKIPADWNHTHWTVTLTVERSPAPRTSTLYVARVASTLPQSAHSRNVSLGSEITNDVVAISPDDLSIVAIGILRSAKTSITALHVRSKEALTSVAARAVNCVVGPCTHATIAASSIARIEARIRVSSGFTSRPELRSFECCRLTDRA